MTFLCWFKKKTEMMMMIIQMFATRAKKKKQIGISYLYKLYKCTPEWIY